MDSDLAIHVPLAYVDLQLTDVDWGELTVPQRHACRGLHERRARLPRGKVLGGSSSINAMLYVRGNREDFDRWRDLGAEGWSYEEVLPYFKKSEDFRGSSGEDAAYHGRGGYMTVSHATQYRTQAARSFVEGAKELGYEELDPNGESQLGVSFGQFTIRDGKRWSAARAFVHPVRDRENLFVVTGKTSSLADFQLWRQLSRGRSARGGHTRVRNGTRDDSEGSTRGNPIGQHRRHDADPAPLRHRPQEPPGGGWNPREG